jgi:hypothetical protein
VFIRITPLVYATEVDGCPGEPADEVCDDIVMRLAGSGGAVVNNPSVRTDVVTVFAAASTVPPR